MRNLLEDWDWEDTFLTLLVAIAIFGLALLATISFSSHDVNYYYASGGGTGRSCVYAHWTWHADELAYCSEDPQKVLDFLERANATRRAK